MLYLSIILACLFIINGTISGILFYKYLQQKREIDEIITKIKVISETFISFNKTCEKTVANSTASISELARRVAQCEIIVNQTANAVKILSSGIRSQQSYSTNY